MRFKKIINKSGQERWYRDGKLCRWDEVPVDIRNSFGKTPVCLFCGDSPTHKRHVSDVAVRLCENCYFEKTIGEIKEKINKGAQDEESLGEESQEDNKGGEV